jgi:zinc/manganese transport system permease protein
MNLSALDIGLLGPAVAAGMLVLATHVPLGIQVLSRGIVFIDLAIAQIAGLGVIGAEALGFGTQGIAVQIAAISAAVAGGLILTYTDKRWPDVQEALIGVSFVLAATGGLMLLSHDPHGGEHIRDLLSGQILWVSYTQLLPVLVASLLILGLWFSLRNRLGRMGFYLIFACAVTVSVQLVGVYLVFASLIVPALTVRQWPAARRMPVAYLVGIASYVIGLVVSALFDLPPGAVIVWSMVILGLIFGKQFWKKKTAIS